MIALLKPGGAAIAIRVKRGAGGARSDRPPSNEGSGQPGDARAIRQRVNVRRHVLRDRSRGAVAAPGVPGRSPKSRPLLFESRPSKMATDRSQRLKRAGVGSGVIAPVSRPELRHHRTRFR